VVEEWKYVRVGVGCEVMAWTLSVLVRRRVVRKMRMSLEVSESIVCLWLERTLCGGSLEASYVCTRWSVLCRE